MLGVVNHAADDGNIISQHRILRVDLSVPERQRFAFPLRIQDDKRFPFLFFFPTLFEFLPRVIKGGIVGISIIVAYLEPIFLKYTLWDIRMGLVWLKFSDVFVRRRSISGLCYLRNVCYVISQLCFVRLPALNRAIASRSTSSAFAECAGIRRVTCLPFALNSAIITGRTFWVFKKHGPKALAVYRRRVGPLQFPRRLQGV